MDALANLLGAFALVFIAELGDKTQLACCRRPASSCTWPILWCEPGAYGDGVGAVAGQLSRRLCRPTLQIIAGILFVIMGGTHRLESRKVQAEEAACGQEGARAMGLARLCSHLRPALVAELGDKTQLAVSGWQQRQQVIPVFSGLPWLTAVTGLAVLGGSIARLMPRPRMLAIAAGLLRRWAPLMSIGTTQPAGGQGATHANHQEDLMYIARHRISPNRTA